MREYGRVYASFWTSKDTRALSSDAKVLAAYLIAGPHTTMLGAFRLPNGYIREDLGWTDKKVSESLSELSRNGFATVCERCNWVFVRAFLHWNGPENPNQRKAVKRLAEQVPKNCGFYADFVRIINTEMDEIVLTIGNGSETLSEGLPTQDQDQESEQEQDTAIAEPPTKVNGKADRKSSLPNDFSLDPGLIAYASNRLPDVDIPELLSSFCGKAKAGGWKYVDWRSAFQEFVRNAKPGSGHWAQGQYPRHDAGKNFR